MLVQNPDCKEPVVSRRSFVKLTVGTIAMLPTVTDSLLLPRMTAFADEEEQAAPLVEGTTVHIVRTNELGLVVRDVSVPEDDAANLVAGAHVKITSRFNGAVVEGDTDAAGGITFDISKLSEDDGMQDIPARYEFNATIEISAPGYREFRADLYRVEGGMALGIPTQPRQEGLPYPVSASFDEWDVLYTEGDAASFVSCTGNDAEHTIAIRLADCPANAAIAAGIFADGKQVASATTKAAADGTATVSFSDTFLLSNSKAALPTGDDHSYTMRYTLGDTTYEAPIKPVVQEAPPEAQDLELKKDLALVPFNDTSMFIGVSIPKGFPIIGGTKFQLWKPEYWVDFAYDPFGFIRLKFTTPEWGYIRDNGKPDKDAWKFHPRDTPKKQWNKMVEGLGDKVNKTLDASDKPGKVKQTSFTQKLSFTAQLDFTAAATWEFSEKLSRGRAQAGLRIGINYSLMEQFFLGAVPIVIRFSIGLNATAVGQVGYVSPSVWKFTEYRWDWSSTGFDLLVCLAPTLSVGVGIGGVATLSLKGSASVSFALHEGPKPKGFEDLPVHLRLAYNASLSVVMELFIFTQTFTLCKVDEPNWHDNWKGLLNSGEVSALPPALSGKTFGQAMSEAKIITSKSLADVVEFETVGVKGMNPEPTTLTHYALNRKTSDGEEPVASLFMTDETAMQLSEQPTVLLVSQSDDEANGGRAVPESGSKDEKHGLIAGTSSALLAQDDEQVEYVLRPANDQATLWETNLPSAKAVGDHEYVAIPAAKPGVLSLGKEQGFFTSSDMRIANNILSASHLKLFSTEAGDYVVRIGVVRVAGNVRTRLIAERVGSSERRVIDFKTTENRDDCFDYDFDISSTHVNGEEIVNMVVISGTRPNGDATTLVTAAGQTFFSFLSCKNWSGDATFTGLTLDATQHDAIGNSLFKYRSYSCPQIRQIKRKRNGKEYGQAVVTFLERASLHDWAIMLDDSDLVRTGVGLLFFSDQGRTIDISGMSSLWSIVTQQVKDPSLMEAKLSEQAGGWQVLMLKGQSQTHYALLEIDPCYGVIHGDVPIADVKTASLVDLGDREVPRLVSVPAQGHFLTCIDGKLKKVAVNTDGDAPTLAFTDIEGTDINMNDFGVAASGDVLYWPAARDDGGYDIDEEGNATLRTGSEGELYQIMGARIRNGKISRGMVLSEVGHPIHRIRSFEQSSSYLSFISSDAIDDETGKGELWYTAIPWVRCVTLVEAIPSATVLAAGDQISFYLTLRNDGNCFLAGAELAVAEVGQEPFATMRLDFSADNTLESVWNPSGDDGELTGVEDDWALAPGMGARYRTEYVAIPESWEGDKQIEVFVTAVHTTASGSLSTQAEDESIEFIPNQRARSTLMLGGSSSPVEYAGEYSPSDVTVTKNDSGKDDTGEDEKQGGGSEDGSQDSAGGNKRSNTPATGTSSSRSTLPGTGDAFALAAAAAAVAAGAAGVAVRNARRPLAESGEAGEQPDSHAS